MARTFKILVERTEFYEHLIELTEAEVVEHFPDLDWGAGQGHVSVAGQIEDELFDGLPPALYEEHRVALDMADPYDHEVKITARED